MEPKDQVPGRTTPRALRLALAAGTLAGACGGDARVLPEIEARPLSPLPPLSAPILASPPPRSRSDAAPTRPAISFGPTRAGHLEDPRLLPTALDFIRPTPAATRRDALHGDDGLIEALVRAARRVADAHPGSILWVGDLSLAKGGPFPPHASHTNGRDADLAFYTSGPAGAIADTGVMRAVDPSGRVAGGELRFDATRNWRLVELLLRDPRVQVQWIFVASHLRTLLLDAARGADADPILIERAARVLQQPRDSSPHADHFHIRIYCDRNDRLLGCVDAPPFHPWVDRHEDAIRAWLGGLRPFLELPGTDEYRFAIDRIARLHVTEALAELETLPPPSDPADAALLAEAIRHLRGRPDARDRWRALAPSDTPP